MLVLGMLHLGSESLTFEEGISYWSAERKPWGDVFSDEPNIAFYYSILKLIAGVIGTSEFALRLPSVIFAAATVPVVAAIGGRIWGPGTALIAAGLMATSAYVIELSQDARQYTLVLFLVSLSTLLLMRALATPRGFGRWAAWALVSAAAFYAHLYAAFVLVAQAAAIAAHPRRPPGRTLVAAAVLLVALIAPLTAVMLGDDLSRLQGVQDVTWAGIRETIEGITGGATLGWALVAVAVAGLGVTILARRRGAARPETWHLVLIVGWMVLPFVLMAIGSLARPTFVPRYMTVAVPGITLLIAAGLARIRPAPLLAAVVTAVLAVSAVRISDTYEDQRQADWRFAGRIVSREARPGDAILLTGGAYPNFHYYYDPSFDPVGTSIFYASGTDAATLSGRRVWVVDHFSFGVPHDHEPAQRLAALERTRTAVKTGREITVELWEPARTVAVGPGGEA